MESLQAKYEGFQEHLTQLRASGSVSEDALGNMERLFRSVYTSAKMGIEQREHDAYEAVPPAVTATIVPQIPPRVPQVQATAAPPPPGSAKEAVLDEYIRRLGMILESVPQPRSLSHLRPAPAHTHLVRC
ncbi:hypothetical protein KIPB_006059 [Kipferlia bialata]|uniref:Uncharacterized protein n=1 Tax=Kipferlia bialata TaxID=797122 RepID=A0A391NUB8_9EUKA|nr:hypothetical protein KIPB_006059 [Kipferlia bialata]|eukprot:g6059.t1